MNKIRVVRLKNLQVIKKQLNPNLWSSVAPLKGKLSKLKALAFYTSCGGNHKIPILSVLFILLVTIGRQVRTMKDRQLVYVISMFNNSNTKCKNSFYLC